VSEHCNRHRTAFGARTEICKLPASGDSSAIESVPAVSIGSSRSAVQRPLASRANASGDTIAADVVGVLAGSGKRTMPDTMSLGGAATWRGIDVCARTGVH
jgi:hypothetical protein